MLQGFNIDILLFQEHYKPVLGLLAMHWVEA